MDKSREQFEAAIKQMFGDLIDQRVCKNGDGEYMAWDMQVAWWAWRHHVQRWRLSYHQSLGSISNSWREMDGIG
ncbi:hypothetical protein ACT47O_002520 [Cronobacter sakazakii]